MKLQNFLLKMFEYKLPVCAGCGSRNPTVKTTTDGLYLCHMKGQGRQLPILSCYFLSH